ncbi:MAG: hypothetical protein HYX26_04170 [Acidobacteriales bacterium]|nr:hypothetical protein [Terriglobales bacterium]
MTILLIVFGVLLAVLIMLLIYRSTLEMHEDDQLFLTEGESGMAKEQAEVLAKLSKVEPSAPSAVVKVMLRPSRLAVEVVSPEPIVTRSAVGVASPAA